MSKQEIKVQTAIDEIIGGGYSTSKFEELIKTSANYLLFKEYQEVDKKIDFLIKEAIDSGNDAYFEVFQMNEEESVMDDSDNVGKQFLNRIACYLRKIMRERNDELIELYVRFYQNPEPLWNQLISSTTALDFNLNDLTGAWINHVEYYIIKSDLEELLKSKGITDYFYQNFISNTDYSNSMSEPITPGIARRTNLYIKNSNIGMSNIEMKNNNILKKCKK